MFVYLFFLFSILCVGGGVGGLQNWCRISSVNCLRNFNQDDRIRSVPWYLKESRYCNIGQHDHS